MQSQHVSNGIADSGGMNRRKRDTCHTKGRVIMENTTEIDFGLFIKQF
jgi:hypothetical protein